MFAHSGQSRQITIWGSVAERWKPDGREGWTEGRKLRPDLVFEGDRWEVHLVRRDGACCWPTDNILLVAEPAAHPGAPKSRRGVAVDPGTFEVVDLGDVRARVPEAVLCGNEQGQKHIKRQRAAMLRWDIACSGVANTPRTMKSSVVPYMTTEQAWTIRQSNEFGNRAMCSE
eukprot:SAG11_NODE_1186_length_5590_cov_2.852850_2_plen_172_part_00